MATSLTELNNLFGSDNIEKWADLNNNRDEAEIAARIAWSIALATAMVKSRINGTRYTYTTVASHEIVVHLETVKAGLLLYSNRATSEEDPGKNPMRMYEKEFDKTIKQLSMGEITLDTATTGRSFPAVVTDDNGDISTFSAFDNS